MFRIGAPHRGFHQLIYATVSLYTWNTSYSNGPREESPVRRQLKTNNSCNKKKTFHINPPRMPYCFKTLPAHATRYNIGPSLFHSQLHVTYNLFLFRFNFLRKVSVSLECFLISLDQSFLLPVCVRFR